MAHTPDHTAAMNGAPISGAWAARPSTGAQPATITMVVIHNMTRRQVPGTLRMENARPKANSTVASHTDHSGKDLGNTAGLPCEMSFETARFTRLKIPSAPNPAASSVESDPMA